LEDCKLALFVMIEDVDSEDKVEWMIDRKIREMINERIVNISIV